jgi:hypothetical protein
MFVVIRNSNFNNNGHRYPFSGTILEIFSTKELAQNAIDENILYCNRQKITNPAITELSLFILSNNDEYMEHMMTFDYTIETIDNIDKINHRWD